MHSFIKATRICPLEKKKIMHDGLNIFPFDHMGKISVQKSSQVSQVDFEIFEENFQKLFNITLPPICMKTLNYDQNIMAVCVIPNQWMILSDEKKIVEIQNFCKKTAQYITLVATDMTDQYLCVDIKGQYARALLAKGCVFDLDKMENIKNLAARTLLKGCNITLWSMGKNHYRFLFDVSLDEYLWHWFEQVSQEFHK